MSEKCARCGFPIEKTNMFVVYDDELYCMTCYELVTAFMEAKYDSKKIYNER